MVLAAVVVAALIAIAVLAAYLSQSRPGVVGVESTAAPSASATAAPSIESDTVVDPEVVDRGWVAEPITTDPETYARAALEAAGTFETSRASRDEWVSWLKTWFTPSPLYADPTVALEQMERYQDELDEQVLLPQTDWDDLATTDGQVSATVSGPLGHLELPETSAVHVWTFTGDVVLTYSRADDTSEDYTDTVRVSVQVVCAGDSIPTAGSQQRPGDCKVVRFFAQAVS
jgi:hypothetical protein